VKLPRLKLSIKGMKFEILATHYLDKIRPLVFVSARKKSRAIDMVNLKYKGFSHKSIKLQLGN
jgi:hypothetical protein